jgi:hypothetical protein
LADKYGNDIMPTPSQVIKMRAYMGIEQSIDENDLKPEYSIHSHNVDYSRNTIKCAPGIELSDLFTYNYATVGEPDRLYRLHAFYKREADSTVSVWLVAVARVYSAPPVQYGVWVRCVRTEQGYPETWQKIHAITANHPSPSYQQAYWNFINYEDANIGELIFTTGYDVYKWTGTYTGGVANQATKLSYTSESVHAPRGRLTTLYKERVFIAGVADSPDTVWWSNELQPDEWTIASDNPDDAGKLNIPTWDGDYITAIVALNDELLIFKKYSLFRLSGNAPSSFAVTKVSGVGTPFCDTVCRIGDRIYFLSRQGLMVFDGVNLTPLIPLEKVEVIKRLVNDDNYALINSGSVKLFSHGKKIILSTGISLDYTPNEAEKTTPQVVEVDAESGAVSFRNDQFCQYRFYNDEHKELPKSAYLWGATEYDDYLYCTDGTSLWIYDNGTTTIRERYWETPSTLDTGYVHMFHAVPQTDLGVAGKKKRVSKITLSGKGGTVKITPVCDGVQRTPITMELPADYGVLRSKIVSWRGRRIGFYIENVDGDPVEITDIELEYMPQGV